MSDNKFTPVGGLVLIKPLKLKYKTQTQIVPKQEITEEDVKSEKEVELETVKQKIKLQHQLAEVVSIGNLDSDKLGYAVGDIVVYDLHMIRPFDLVKGTCLMSAHNVIGVWLG